MTNGLDMMDCPKKPGARITETTCIARQGLIKNQGPTESPGLVRLSRNGHIMNMEMCVGCSMGLNLFKNQKRGVTMDQKKCSKCGQTKNVNMFYKNASSRDGLQNWCKKCMNFQIAVKRHDGNIPAILEREPIELEQIPAQAQEPTETEEIPMTNPDHGFPMPMEPKRRVFLREKIDSQPDETPTQICSICKKPLPLTAEFYHVKKDRVNGFRHDCKECRAKTRADNKSEYRIILDLTDMPELLAKIKTWSKDELREPDKQIIYFLKKSADAWA